MLPNFLVIGTMKGGTSSLYRYLLDHPQIFMPSLKEPCSFRATGNGVSNGTRDFSTDRLIYLVRDPVDRMVSQYEHRAKGGNTKGVSHEEALLNDEAYCNVSSYAMQIDQYLEHFRPDQLLVLKSEDLKTDRIRTVRRVYEFLGVDGSWQPSHVWREFHTGSGHRRPVDHLVRKLPAYRSLASVTPLPLKRLKYRLTTRKAAPVPQLSERVRRELEDRLRDDVKRLRDYMGEDLDEWGVA
jgi:hypothetical protein